MGLKKTLARTKRRLRRLLHLRGLDSVEQVRARHGDFDALRQRVREAGTDDLAYFKNDYAVEGGLYLQQNPDEFAALCLFLKERSPFEQYMEIGSASGGSCLFLYQQQLGFRRVLSLDDGQHRRAVEQEKNLGQVPGCVRFVGDSHSPAASKFLQENVQGKLDLAFIDGDHSYEGVCKDIELTLPFCRPGTFLIFHDTVACVGVENAWLELARGSRAKPVAELIGQKNPLGIGVAQVA